MQIEISFFFIVLLTVSCAGLTYLLFPRQCHNGCQGASCSSWKICAARTGRRGLTHGHSEEDLSRGCGARNPQSQWWTGAYLATAAHRKNPVATSGLCLGNPCCKDGVGRPRALSQWVLRVLGTPEGEDGSERDSNASHCLPRQTTKS